MDTGGYGAPRLLALLAVLAALYPLMPVELWSEVWYDAVGVLCMACAWWGVRRHRPAQSRGWLMVVGGFVGWVLADMLYTVEVTVWQLDGYPVPSDAVYLTSYLIVGLGLLILVRGRRSHHDLGVLLDAAIIATGTGVLAGVFVLMPIVDDSSLSTLGKLVAAAYPLTDVLMAAMLVRLWRSPASTSPAFRLLSCALLVNLCSDVAWLASAQVTAATYMNLGWLSSYVLVAASCLSLSSDGATDASAARVEPTRLRTQLVALTGGLMLPALALLINGASSDRTQWEVIGFGSLALSVLVLTRMARLLNVVQVQAVQLAALARSDSLTGAPNRRTWDHELSVACRQARASGELLCIALIDLDHFKRFNDTHGHPAGDRLLREAVAGWTDLLDEGDLLARYGGEEFAVLLPGSTPAQASVLLDRLRAATPQGQTFSAGVALWDPDTVPADAVRSADEALYDAKRAGRDQVSVAGGTAPARLPQPVVVLQPIIDLRTGELVAMEALSRFGDQSPLTVFERAHACGFGPELEAAAIRAALRCRPDGLDLTVNVSLASLLHPRIAEVLPMDLHGIVLEITEHSDVTADPALERALGDLRRRGARLAVDDWGKGFSNMDRLLRLRPEVVKIDLSLVHALNSEYHRAMVRSVSLWADEVGATVCAEGVETEGQRDLLVELGVHWAQGYLFGAPASPGTYTGQAVDSLTTG